MIPACAQPPIQPAVEQNLLQNIRIIDAHAHPDQFHKTSPSRIDQSSTLAGIKALGMAASSFAAVGDRSNPYGTPLSYYQSAKVQLRNVQDLAKANQVKLILKASDVPPGMGFDHVPGAILAIEGGDPLEGKPDRVDEFYHLGVRMITLVHYRNNELGDIMMGWGGKKVDPVAKGLTPAGRKVLERMQGLGMVVDVAHAHPLTLKDIAEMTGKPLVDSHTSVCPYEDSPRCGRMRSWKDMEWVARTGGVVCTWPWALRRGAFFRKTFLDWAKEIWEMKKRLGIDHVGLGTDGGGSIPRFVDGYRDVRDLVHLISAMQEVGLSAKDIRSYMGGNSYRVLEKCLG
jgi:microsomal dipeptidase-like Zn-dependent dipeptidase